MWWIASVALTFSNGSVPRTLINSFIPQEAS